MRLLLPLLLLGGGVTGRSAASAALAQDKVPDALLASTANKANVASYEGRASGSGARASEPKLPEGGGGDRALGSTKEESLVITKETAQSPSSLSSKRRRPGGSSSVSKAEEERAGTLEESEEGEDDEDDDESFTDDRIRWADEHGAPLLIFDPHQPRGVAERKVLARGDRPLAVDWVQLMRVWAHDEDVWTETELLGVAGLLQALRRTVSPTMIYASVLVLLLAALLLQPSDSGDHKTLSRKVRDVKLARQQMQEQKERLQTLRESAEKSALQIKALTADETDSDFAVSTLREIPSAIARTAAQRAGLGAHSAAVAGGVGPNGSWSPLARNPHPMTSPGSSNSLASASATDALLPQGFCAGSDWGLLAEATDMRLKLARDLAREPRALQQQLRMVLRVAEMRSEVLQLQQRQGVGAQTETDDVEDGGRGANDRSTEAADYLWFLGEARAILSQNTQEAPPSHINTRPSAATERMQSVLLYGLWLQKRAEVWELQKKGREEVKRAKKNMGLLSAPLSDIRSKLQGRVARYQASTALAVEKARVFLKASKSTDSDQSVDLFRELQPSISQCLEALAGVDVQAVSAPPHDAPLQSPKEHRESLDVWLETLSGQVEGAAAEEAALFAKLGGARANAASKEDTFRIDKLTELVIGAISSRTDLLFAVSRAQQQLAEVAAKHSQLSTELKHHENVISEINKSLRFMTVEMKRVKKLAEGRQ